MKSQAVLGIADGPPNSRRIAWDPAQPEAFFGKHSLVLFLCHHLAYFIRQLIEAEGGGDTALVDWIWSWAVVDPERSDDGGMPAATDRSTALAKELKRRGWRFFGPTTAYAFMQSEGLTNDHHPECFVHDECDVARTAFLAGRDLR